MNDPAEDRYVSRGGVKLAFALDDFALNPRGLICADLGSNVGGFVDCLLRRGAESVYSVDTSYGTLAWTLRKDDRVVVLERTNAMHVELPQRVDLVTIDVAWTRQKLIVPHAASLLRSEGRIVTLIKPHYEAAKDQLAGGVLRPEFIEQVLTRVLGEIEEAGLEILATVRSPIAGHAGNREAFALLAQRSPAAE